MTQQYKGDPCAVSDWAENGSIFARKQQPVCDSDSSLWYREVNFEIFRTNVRRISWHGNVRSEVENF